jgi:hypothetical protein
MLGVSYSTCARGDEHSSVWFPSRRFAPLGAHRADGNVKVDWEPRSRHGWGRALPVGRPSDPRAIRAQRACRGADVTRRSASWQRPLRRRLRPRSPHSTLIEMRVAQERPPHVRWYPMCPPSWPLLRSPPFRIIVHYYVCIFALTAPTLSGAQWKFCVVNFCISRLGPPLSLPPRVLRMLKPIPRSRCACLSVILREG